MRAVRSRVVQALSQTQSTGLRHPSLEEGAGKRCSECDSVCLFFVLVFVFLLLLSLLV